jgi:GST-like protein
MKRGTLMSQYQPAKVWTDSAANGGKYSGINRPTAGARYAKSLPVGNHPIQLYSLATPNGVKVTVLLEELLEAGVTEAEYDAYIVRILDGDQFGSDFVDINPNSKIPALVDRSGDTPVKLFESGAILLYLAEKFDKFIPQGNKRAQCLSWLFWQMGSAPFVGGGFGHFYAYAPEKLEYPINRYTMETKRQLDVLNQHLATHTYMCGDEYTIADIAIWPWYGVLVQGGLYEAAEFLDVQSYPYVMRWAELVGQRPAVKRGRIVNKDWGDENAQLPERHSEADFVGKNV